MNRNELYHYGVAGMKWGVRRYQNYDGTLTSAGRAHQAKQYQKQLNSLDKSTKLDKREVIENEAKAAKYTRKMNKTADTSKKAMYDVKIKEHKSKASEATKSVEKVDEKAKKLLEQVKKEGYSVGSKEVYRNAVKGKDFVTSAMKTVIAYPIAVAVGSPLSPVFVPYHPVEGTKYKVRG